MGKPVSGGGKPAVTVKINGVEDLDRFLRELPQEMAKTVILGAMREGAKVIQARAVELAPRTGSATANAFNKAAAEKGEKKHLYENIKVVRPGKKALRQLRDVVYRVFVRHPLAHIVEYGTARRFHKSGKSVGVMPALSYMRRAVDERGPAAVEAIAQRARRLMDGVVRKLARGKK